MPNERHSLPWALHVVTAGGLWFTVRSEFWTNCVSFFLCLFFVRYWRRRKRQPISLLFIAPYTAWTVEVGIIVLNIQREYNTATTQKKATNKQWNDAFAFFNTLVNGSDMCSNLAIVYLLYIIYIDVYEPIHSIHRTETRFHFSFFFSVETFSVMTT